MKTTHRIVSVVLAASIGSTGFVPRGAHAALIGTEQLAANAGPKEVRGALLAALARDDLRRALAERGVAPERLAARIAALTDDEAVQLAARIDDAPAGAGDVIGYAVVVFAVLLASDILGFTRIFPFTRMP